MPVFSCNGCGATLQLGDEHAGKQVQCPTCKSTVTVPSPDAITTEPPRPAAAATDTTAPPPVAAGADRPRRRRAEVDDDDDETDDDDRPRRRPRAPAKASSGLGGCAIAMIVCGVLALFIIPCLLALLIPAVQKVREAAARTQTMNNMKQIGLAFHNHSDANRFMPTQKALSPINQKPIELSWRVSILPFIEQQGLFMRIDQNAAWDAPQNQSLSNAMPKVYENLLRETNAKDRSATDFQVFTGPKTLYPTPTERVTLGGIADGSSNTFLFAEGVPAARPWLRPMDMTVPLAGPLPLPPDRFLVGMCDGSVRMVDRRRASDEVLRLAIDPRDGQVIFMDF